MVSSSYRCGRDRRAGRLPSRSVPGEVEDDVARLEQAREIMEEAHSTPGAAVRRDIDRVFRSFYVFVRNAAELRDLIVSEQRLERAMLTPHDEIDRALDEIDRLLHNFLAASFTLYSHEQKLRKRYLTAKELAEYDRRSPGKNEIYKLVQELRNSAQHSRLPLVRQHLSARFERGEVAGGAATFKIEPAYIETLTNLSAKARRRFVEQAERDEGLALLPVVLEATDVIIGFFRWFMSAIETSQAPALAHTDGLRRAAHLLAVGRTPSSADEEGPKPS